MRPAPRRARALAPRKRSREGCGGNSQAYRIPPAKLGESVKGLWVSDAVWTPTGYGVTSKQICARMVKDGHAVYNYAPGAFTFGETVTPEGITVLSSLGGDDRWGNATLPYHLRRIQP